MGKSRKIEACISEAGKGKVSENWLHFHSIFQSAIKTSPYSTCIITITRPCQYPEPGRHPRQLPQEFHWLAQLGQPVQGSPRRSYRWSRGESPRAPVFPHLSRSLQRHVGDLAVAVESLDYWRCIYLGKLVRLDSHLIKGCLDVDLDV